MKTLFLLGVLVAAWVVASATPTYTTQNMIDLFAVNFSTTDLLHSRPYVLETSGAFPVWLKGSTSNMTTLTAAFDANSPVADTYLWCPSVCVIRWDFGGPIWQLDTLRVWWTQRDPARNAVNLKFAVRDYPTQTWRDITTYQCVPTMTTKENTYARMTITFPPGEVTNFDALRFYDGSSLVSVCATRFVHIDAEGQENE